MAYYGGGVGGTASSSSSSSQFMQQGVVASAAPQYSLASSPPNNSTTTTPQQYQATAPASAGTGGYYQWDGARQQLYPQQQQYGFSAQQAGNGSPYGPYYGRYNQYYAPAPNPGSTTLPRAPPPSQMLPIQGATGYYNGASPAQGYPQQCMSSQPTMATTMPPMNTSVMQPSGSAAGKGAGSPPQQWQQQVQGRPHPQSQQSFNAHTPRYSGPDQQGPSTPQRGQAVAQAGRPEPLVAASPSGAMPGPNTPASRPGMTHPGMARSGSRYDQRQRRGKGGKGVANSNAQGVSRADQVVPQRMPAQGGGPRATSSDQTLAHPQTAVLNAGAPPAVLPTSTVDVRGDRTCVRPVPNAATPEAAIPTVGGSIAPTTTVGAPTAAAPAPTVPARIAISDTRKPASSTGPKYSELMASVLPPLRPGEAEFVLELWTDKRARFPLRSTVLSSRWQSSPEHTCRHKMQIFPRGYQLKDLPAAQRKPTDSWLAVNVAVENEQKPQSPFVGAAYPWAPQVLSKQVMLWIPNYKSPSTSIIRYGPGVFSKDQPTLGWSGLLDLQSDPSKLIDAGWIDSSGKLVVRSMVVDTEKEVVVKVAFTSSWLKTKQEVADAQAKLKLQQQLELDREAEAARRTARELALASSKPTPSPRGSASPGVAAPAGTVQGPQERKWIAPAFPNQEVSNESRENDGNDRDGAHASAEEPYKRQHTADRAPQEAHRSSGNRGRRGGRNRNGKQEVITVVTHKPGQEKEMIGMTAGAQEGQGVADASMGSGWAATTSGEDKKRKSLQEVETHERRLYDESPKPVERSRVSTYDARPVSKRPRSMGGQPLGTPTRSNHSKVMRESWEGYDGEGWDGDKSKRRSEGQWEKAEWEEPRSGPGDKMVDAWKAEETRAGEDSWRSTPRQSAAAEWIKCEVPKESWEEKEVVNYGSMKPGPRERVYDMRKQSTAVEEETPLNSVETTSQQGSRYMMKEEVGTFAIYGASSAPSDPSFPPVRGWRRTSSRSRDDISQDDLKPLVRDQPPRPQSVSGVADRPAVSLRPRSAQEMSINDDRPTPGPSRKQRRRSGGTPARARPLPSKQRPSHGHMVYDRPAGHDMAYYQRQASRR